jgi:uncharacterized membrane protein
MSMEVTEPRAVAKSGRLEALSDGIFAVAMTLLVVTFDVIKLPAGLDGAKIERLLLDEWPDVMNYAEGFVIVAAFWTQHHHLFHRVVRYDWRLVWLNFIGLMLVVLIPMTTSIVSDYGDVTVAAAVFEGNMLLTGLAFYACWVYASRRYCLIDRNVDRRVVRMGRRRAMVIPVVSAAAMALSAITPRWSTVLFFFVPPILMLIARTSGLSPEEADEV